MPCRKPDFCTSGRPILSSTVLRATHLAAHMCYQIFLWREALVQKSGFALAARRRRTQQRKRGQRVCPLASSFVVGVTRFELVTSSVSGKRSPPELNALMLFAPRWGPQREGYISKDRPWCATPNSHFFLGAMERRGGRGKSHVSDPATPGTRPARDSARARGPRRSCALRDPRRGRRSRARCRLPSAAPRGSGPACSRGPRAGSSRSP